MGVIIVLFLEVIVLMIVTGETIFYKAGKPEWASIVPIYNVLVLLDIVGKPRWWILLMLVPILNFAILIVILHSLSLSFNKNIWFTVGLLFLGILFFPILAFGKSKYIGPIKHN